MLLKLIIIVWNKNTVSITLDTCQLLYTYMQLHMYESMLSDFISFVALE